MESQSRMLMGTAIYSFWEQCSTHLQSFADCSRKMLIRYNFFDLDSIHNKLSSDYTLNICFSCRFSHADGQSFPQYNTLKIVHFLKVGKMPILFANCTHLLTRTQEKKFEDVFLIKIANKGTTLREGLTV